MTDFHCPICCHAAAGVTATGAGVVARACSVCGFEAVDLACVRTESPHRRSTVLGVFVCEPDSGSPVFRSFSAHRLPVSLSDRHGRTLVGGGSAWHIFDDRPTPTAALDVRRPWQFEAFRDGRRVLGFGRSLVAALQSFIVPGHVPEEVAGLSGCSCEMCRLGVEDYRRLFGENE